MGHSLLKDENGLTELQAKLVDLYDGDVKSTAELAGCSPQYAHRLLTGGESGCVTRALKARLEKERLEGLVADRIERMAFWTTIMRGAVTEETKDRLKASELLGKAFMDFVDKHIVESKVDATVSATIRGIDERVAQIKAATELDWL